MRFAYIDSQGKEVAIPSVEALQLRIELGAIVESTMFFDAGADRWAAAGEHEIFRTLSRELKEREEGTFVAPPPPAPEAPEAPRTRGPNPFDREEGTSVPEETVAAELPEDPPAPPEEEAEGPSFDLGGFDLADPAPPAAEPPASSDEGGFDLGGFGSLDLVEDPPEAAAPEPPAPAPEPPAAADEAAPEEGAPSAFDLGEFGALELEGGPEEDEAPPAHGMELEQSFADQHDAPGTAAGGGMELEAPLSEYSHDEPPSWMLEEDDEDEEEQQDEEHESPLSSSGARSRSGSASGEGGRGRGAAGGVEGDDEEPRRRAPQARPATSRETLQRSRKRSNVGGILVGVVVLAVLGVGGWFGWSALQGGDEPVAVQEPEVVLPPLAASLEPRMRELGRLAYVVFLDSVRDMAAARDLPAEPDPGWLSGNYLGNASRFEQVDEYWSGIEGLVDDVRGAEDAIFTDALDPLLERPGLAAEERAQIRARAVAGFQAAARDRRQVYAQFDSLSNAALDLHDFLLGNEDLIEYSPVAGGLSRDPVVEAVPATPQLGEEMWDRVGRIPDALDDLGALDKVSTGRLVDLLVQKLDAIPIR